MAGATELRVHGQARGRDSAVDRTTVRIERSRARLGLNDLRRERLHLGAERGRTDRFGPEPGAGREADRRAIDGRLIRLQREIIQRRGQLGRIDRRLDRLDEPATRAVPSDLTDRRRVVQIPGQIPAAAILGTPALDREAASEAARDYVNQLLRASEDRVAVPD